MKVKMLTLDLEVDGKEIHLEINEGLTSFGNCYYSDNSPIGNEMATMYFMGALASIGG